VPGSRCQGVEVRREDGEYLLSAKCLLLTAYSRCPGGWALGDEGPPAASAGQDHSLNLFCGSRKATHLGKEFFFRNEAGISMKTKDQCWKPGNEAGISMKTKKLRPLKRECR